MTTAFVGNFTDTWNNISTTFNGIKLDVTDTASASDSALVDLQIGSSSRFKVAKDGSITSAGSLTASGASFSGTVAGDFTLSGDVVLTGSPDFSGVGNKATIRSDLGLEIGSDVLAYSATLASIDQGLATTDSPTFAGVTLSNNPTAETDATRKAYVDAAVSAIITADYTVETASDAAGLAATMTDGQRLQTMARDTLGDGGGALWELDATLGDVTGDASITAGTYTPSALSFNPSTGVNTTTDVITIAGHGLSDGDRIWYDDDGSDTAIGGLSLDNLYWVRDATTDTFKVAATPNGDAIDLTSAPNETQEFIPANGFGRVSHVDVTDVGGSGSGAKAYILQSMLAISASVRGTIVKAWIDPRNPGSGYTGTPTADLSGITDLSGASVTFDLADNGSRIAVSGSVRRLKNVTPYGYVDKAFGVSTAASDQSDAINSMLRAGERDGVRCVSTVDAQTEDPVWTRGGFEWHFEKGARVYNQASTGRFPYGYAMLNGAWVSQGVGLADDTVGYSGTSQHSVLTVASTRRSVTLTTASEAGNYSAGDVVILRSEDAAIVGGQVALYSSLNEVQSADAGTGVVTFKYPITFDVASLNLVLVNAEIAPYCLHSAPLGGDTLAPYFAMKDLRMTGSASLRSDTYGGLGVGCSINCTYEIDELVGRNGVFGNYYAFDAIKVQKVIAAGKACELAMGSHDNKVDILSFYYDPDVSTKDNTGAPLIHLSEFGRNNQINLVSADMSQAITSGDRIIYAPFSSGSTVNVGRIRHKSYTGRVIDFNHGANTDASGTQIGFETVDNTIIIGSIEIDAPSELVRFRQASNNVAAKVDRNRVSINAANSVPSSVAVYLDGAYDNALVDCYLPSGGLTRIDGDESLQVIGGLWPEVNSLTAAEKDEVTVIGTQVSAGGLGNFNGSDVSAETASIDALTLGSGTHSIDGTFVINGTLNGPAGDVTFSGDQIKRNADNGVLQIRGGTDAAGGAAFSVYGTDNATGAAGDFILDSVYGNTTTPNSGGQYRFRYYDLDTTSFTEWFTFDPASSELDLDCDVRVDGQIESGANIVVDESAGVRFRSYAATAIANQANAVNTTDKAAGKAVWDSTNNRIMVASGSGVADAWYVADGSASVTPS